MFTHCCIKSIAILLRNFVSKHMRDIGLFFLFCTVDGLGISHTGFIKQVGKCSLHLYFLEDR